MAITFNEEDYNLDQIKRESKLENLKTVNPFRVYGLRVKDKGNPPVRVFVGPGIATPSLRHLAQFFTRNDMKVVCVPNPEDNEHPRIRIGLRRDLRAHPILCSCILQTIVYYLEGKLELKAAFKIPGIPKLR